MALAGCDVWGPPPDVILVTVDGVRADRVGAYGAAREATPALDAFAADGARISHAWSTSCTTVPALGSVVTGKYPTSHGATTDGGVVPDVVVTLAEMLAERGYDTGAFRSGPPLSLESGLFQGYRIHQGAPRDAEAATDAALAWTAAVSPDRPLHLLVSYGDLQPPHDRAAGGAEGYDGELRFVDRQLGRLLEGLRARGRFEQALIVVVGTHGEALGEHGLTGHGHGLYESTLRVPMVIRYPGGISGGTHVETQASLVDVLPLVADEAWLSLPGDVEGVRVGERDVAIAECRRNGVVGGRFDRELFGVVRWPWKLILSDRDPPELYDLSRVPLEQDDRSGRSLGVLVGLSDTAMRIRTTLRPPMGAR